MVQEKMLFIEPLDQGGPSVFTIVLNKILYVLE